MRTIFEINLSLKNYDNNPYEWVFGYKALCSQGFEMLPKATCQMLAELDRQFLLESINGIVHASVKEQILNPKVGDKIEFLDFKAIKIPPIVVEKKEGNE